MGTTTMRIAPPIRDTIGMETTGYGVVDMGIALLFQCGDPITIIIVLHHQSIMGDSIVEVDSIVEEVDSMAVVIIDGD